MSEIPKNNKAWTLPKFNFEVDFGDEHQGVPFIEVTGLDIETDIIEYRNGNSNNKLFEGTKMPGIVKHRNVTMKRGVFVNGKSFWDWHNQIAMNTIQCHTVIIKLLDENGNVTMQWQLINAYPTKITSTDLKSDENEVAIESLEIAYEQLIVKNG